MLGTSKGGELALLLGATYPDEVGAVVGVVPSGLIFPTTSYLIKQACGLLDNYVQSVIYEYIAQFLDK